jgi:hypothetical protein
MVKPCVYRKREIIQKLYDQLHGRVFFIQDVQQTFSINSCILNPQSIKTHVQTQKII